MSEKYTFENTGHTRPRAWHNAKNAFGPTAFGLHALFLGIEKLSSPDQCWLTLAKALHFYIEHSKDDAVQLAENAYWDWFEENVSLRDRPDQEQMSVVERAEFAADFDAAMRKVMGDEKGQVNP